MGLVGNNPALDKQRQVCYNYIMLQKALVRIDRELRNQLNVLATMQGRRLSDEIEIALRKHVSNPTEIIEKKEKQHGR